MFRMLYFGYIKEPVDKKIRDINNSNQIPYCALITIANCVEFESKEF